MKDWVILNRNKAVSLKMAKLENDLDIFYAVGNANTLKKKWNSEDWILITTSTTIVDT